MLLLRYTLNGITKEYRLVHNLTVIGRLPTCDLALPDPSVSRLHANIKMENERCILMDANSRYGTFRNGERITGEVELKPGDALQIGEVELTFEQRVPELELLNEDHFVSEGPGTIFKPVAPADRMSTGQTGGAGAELVRLFAEVGRALVSSHSLSDVLNRVVEVAFSVVPAERAFLMLRDTSEEALTARVLRHRDGTVLSNPTLSRTVIRRVMRERVAVLATDARTDPGLSSADSLITLNVRSFLCAPLWSHDEVVGVLYVDSPRSGQFAPAHLDAFTALAYAAAVGIEQARLSNQLVEEQRRRERLSRYHSPAVVSRILHSEGDGGMRAQERDVTVMFCDLVGFTALCEPLAPAEAAALLNAFLTRMTDCVFAYEGTLDKFIGDALLAVFGAPFDEPQHAFKAIESARAMRKALAQMNEAHTGPPLAMRIAIASGIALTGDIGSPKRREFTVLGDVVNTAARLEEQVCEPGQIVIAAATYNAVKDRIAARHLGSKQLRGRAMSLDVYSIDD